MDSPKTLLSEISTPLAIVVAGALVAVAVYMSGVGTGAPTTPPAEKPLTAQDVVPLQADDHVLGNRDAKIVIVEYTDLECPFCKRFHETMKQVVAEYDGQVAWVLRNFPLTQIHPNAPALAEAAECVASTAGNDAYWKFVDALFSVAPLNTPFPMDKLDATIASVAPLAPVESCIAAGTHRARIEAQIQDAIKARAQGTPHSILLVRGKEPVLISGAQPLEAVRAEIEKALAR